MIKAIAALLMLYLVGMHVSMAMMELFAWTLFTVTLVYQLSHRQKALEFPLWKPMLMILVSVTVSLFATPHEKPWVPQLGFFRWIFLFYTSYWALLLVWSPSFEQKFLRLWQGLVLLAGGYGVFQALTGLDPAHPGKNVVNPQGEGLWKATGFFSMSLTYAYTLGLSTFAVSNPMIQKLAPRKWGILVFSVGLLGLVASMSRGAWIGALMVCGLFIILRSVKLFAAFASLVGVFISALAFWKPGFAEKITGLLALKLDHSSSVRIDLWRAYWEMFKDHPIFGVGIFEGDRLLPAYYERLGIVQPFTSHAHNVYLQWLAGSGVFALAAYLWLSGALLLKAWRMREASPWGWSLLMAQLFCHIGALTEANFFDGEVNHVMVFVWALTLAVDFFSKAQTQRAAA